MTPVSVLDVLEHAEDDQHHEDDECQNNEMAPVIGERRFHGQDEDGVEQATG